MQKHWREWGTAPALVSSSLCRMPQPAATISSSWGGEGHRGRGAEGRGWNGVGVEGRERHGHGTNCECSGAVKHLLAHCHGQHAALGPRLGVAASAHHQGQRGALVGVLAVVRDDLPHEDACLERVEVVHINLQRGLPAVHEARELYLRWGGARVG